MLVDFPNNSCFGLRHQNSKGTSADLPSQQVQFLVTTRISGEPATTASDWRLLVVDWCACVKLWAGVQNGADDYLYVGHYVKNESHH